MSGPNYHEPWSLGLGVSGWGSDVHATRVRTAEEVDESGTDDTRVGRFSCNGRPSTFDSLMALRAVGCVNLLAGVPDALLGAAPRDELTGLALAILRNPGDLTPAAMAADEVQARAVAHADGRPFVPRADLEKILRHVARHPRVDEMGWVGGEALATARALGIDPDVAAAIREHVGYGGEAVRMPFRCGGCYLLQNYDGFAGVARSAAAGAVPVCRACVAEVTGGGV